MPVWARWSRITSLQDGRYNVLLLGVQRVRILKELDPLRSFRQARVELVDDCYDFDSTLRTQETAGAVADSVSAAICRARAKCPSSWKRCSPAICRSACSPIWPRTRCRSRAEVKLQLLAESSVRRRAEVLLSCVQHLAEATPAAAKSVASREVDARLPAGFQRQLAVSLSLRESMPRSLESSDATLR